MVERVGSANGDTAVAARDIGLVDDLLSRSALRDRIKEYAGADSEDETLYSSVSMRDYLGQMRLLHKPKKKAENVAIVVAAGEILDGSQPPGTVGGDSAAALLRKALKDESVKAVVLRVDSPGGSVVCVRSHCERDRSFAGGRQACRCVDEQRGSLGWLLDIRRC